ncbi:MAG TPA: hypothetical protein DCP69_05010 [Candidatus Omnitrophica bacterium]|nr:hypothetical protein [Candidatus Omnitrophota bacterium]
MTFWDSQTFHAYERLCGDEPGTRSRLLASADFQTRVIDLSLSEAELWQGVRKSYHALINAAQKNHGLSWDTQRGGWCRVAEKVCRPVHIESAGRETRPLATWEAMDKWVTAGHGLVVYVSRRTECISTVRGYVYAVVNANWAYYFSSVTLDKNLNHALIWAAMKALKAKGVRYLEMGWQGQAMDEKGKNIELFRRGFGGVDIPAKEAPALCGQSA